MFLQRFCLTNVTLPVYRPSARYPKKSYKHVASVAMNMSVPNTSFESLGTSSNGHNGDCLLKQILPFDLGTNWASPVLIRNANRGRRQVGALHG